MIHVFFNIASATGSSSGSRGQRGDDTGSGAGGDDSRQLPPGQGGQPVADVDSFRVEYISEDELGENYRENYQVERDQVTGEFYILDFENRIKFIIVKDKLGYNVGNFQDAAANLGDELAGPNRVREQLVPGEEGARAQNMQRSVSAKVLVTITVNPWK